MSPSSDVDPVFVSPAARDARQVYGDPVALAKEVYGDPAVRAAVVAAEPVARPRRTKATRRRQGALLRRAEHLASRLAREPRGGAHPASSYDRQELDALRWVLDEVLPSWFGTAG
jgi:hypothetical protein